MLPTMVIDLLDEVGYSFLIELKTSLESLLSQLNLQDRELTIVLCNDVKITTLNLKDRGINEPTDVLSYPTFEPDDYKAEHKMPQVTHLGDIIISVDTAARQAINRNHSLSDEVKILAAHGLTHLLGFDHQTKEQWKVFKKHQQWILNLP